MRMDLGAPRRWLGTACVLLALVTGCGGSDGSAAGDTSSPAGPAAGVVTTSSDGVQEVTLDVPDDYVFTPDAFTVAPGQVRLTVRSTATQAVHNFRFTPGEGPAAIEPQIAILQPGESQTIEFAVTATGDYPFECSFHIQLGQVGIMTVADTGGGAG